MSRIAAVLWLSTLFVAFAMTSISRTEAQDVDYPATIAAMQSTIDAQATTIAEYKEVESSRGERCLEVAPDVQAAIASGFEEESGVVMLGFQAVKSGDYENAYFVAAELDGPGLNDDGDVAVLFTNRIDEVGVIMAVNEVAKAFFVWPDADGTDADATMERDGAEAAVDCSETVLK